MDKIDSWILNRGGVTYDCEELSVLDLVGKTAAKTNEVVDKVTTIEDSNNKKVSHDEMKFIYKHEGADFKGSWHGIEKPQFAEPGIAGVVDNLVSQMEDIATIPSKTNFESSLIECLKISKNIFIPAGEYVASNIVVPQGAKIELDKNAKIKVKNAGDSIFIIRNSDVVIKGGILEGTWKDESAKVNGEYLIRLYYENTRNIFIDTITFINSGDTALVTIVNSNNNVDNINIVNCNFNHCQSAITHWSIGGNFKPKVTNVVIDNNSINYTQPITSFDLIEGSSGGNAITIYSKIDGLKISNNKIVNCGRIALELYQKEAETEGYKLENLITNAEIMNNYIDYSKLISLSICGYNVNVEGNTIKDNTYDIEVNGKNITFRNNTFYECGVYTNDAYTDNEHHNGFRYTNIKFISNRFINPKFRSAYNNFHNLLRVYYTDGFEFTNNSIEITNIECINSLITIAKSKNSTVKNNGFVFKNCTLNCIELINFSNNINSILNDNIFDLSNCSVTKFNKIITISDISNCEIKSNKITSDNIINVGIYCADFSTSFAKANSEVYVLGVSNQIENVINTLPSTPITGVYYLIGDTDEPTLLDKRYNLARYDGANWAYTPIKDIDYMYNKSYIKGTWFNTTKENLVVKLCGAIKNDLTNMLIVKNITSTKYKYSTNTAWLPTLYMNKLTDAIEVTQRWLINNNDYLIKNVLSVNEGYYNKGQRFLLLNANSSGEIEFLCTKSGDNSTKILKAISKVD